MEIKETKKTFVVYVCGGSADVGELTDRAARELGRNGIRVVMGAPRRR